jgi:hypothetical protein
VTELVFEVTEDSEGGCTAECLTENIFTQGDSWDEAVAAFYFDKPSPDRVRLHLIRDEMFALR